MIKKFMSTLLGKLSVALVGLIAIILAMTGHIYTKQTFSAAEPKQFDEITTTAVHQVADYSTGANLTNTFVGGFNQNGTSTFNGSFTTTATSTTLNSMIVKYPFSGATTTPIDMVNPFTGSATTSVANIAVHLTTAAPTGFTFDIATSSGNSFATTSSVLAKAIVVAANNTYDGYFTPLAATSTAGVANVNTTGVLPGNDSFGQSLWFLRPTDRDIMLRIASSSVSNSFTGTLTVTFVK